MSTEIQAHNSFASFKSARANDIDGTGMKLFSTVHGHDATPAMPGWEKDEDTAGGYDKYQLRKYQKEAGRRKSRRAAMVVASISFVVLSLYCLSTLGYTYPPFLTKKSCSSVDFGFTCEPKISHSWGQYSPYFAVSSDIATEVPEQCQITTAQILSRHGARYPTKSAAARYHQLLYDIHTNTTSYSPNFSFIREYKGQYVPDQLTDFGRQQMFDSGVKSYNRYKVLAQQSAAPFVRSSGQERVLESSLKWVRGFDDARRQDSSSAPKPDPASILIISEKPGVNNTLNHGLCTKFEEDPEISELGHTSRGTWANIFTPPISRRLEKNLAGTKFSPEQTIQLMDLCPFDTIANEQGEVSPFCHLFTASEWHAYDYYQTVGKYYGYSWGNPLGPTQGVGFTNELIARLTRSPVVDHTSTNNTLDHNAKTFPLDNQTALFADFSHDNDLTSILAAVGLYKVSPPLSKTARPVFNASHDYSTSRTVPFGARIYFEKLKCEDTREDLIRIIVNDRVLPLESCGGDELGRCTLDKFVDSLKFAQHDGRWSEC